jgi:hypothetical protein
VATSKPLRKPYSALTDAERVQKNWRKTLSLLSRDEFSVAIVRAATTAEIATNLALRAELIAKHNLSPEFVDNLLIWANGIVGKYHKLLLPVLDGSDHLEAITALGESLKLVNKQRNSVAHSGEFKKRSTAHEVLTAARVYIVGVTEPYSRNLDQLIPGVPPLPSEKSVSKKRR